MMQVRWRHWNQYSIRYTRAHSISPIGNIFLGKKYDYPILGSEIQAVIFCVMSKTCCKTFSFSILCTELYWVLAFCSKHAPKQHNSISVKPTVYTLGQWARSYSLAVTMVSVCIGNPQQRFNIVHKILTYNHIFSSLLYEVWWSNG